MEAEYSVLRGFKNNFGFASVVQRRFFNIVAIELLGKQFGLKEMPSAKELRNKKQNVPLANLILNGRNLSLEQYFEVKDELE